MTIKEVQYVIDELGNIILKGGDGATRAKNMLSLEATEYNIRKCLDEIRKEWEKEISEGKK